MSSSGEGRALSGASENATPSHSPDPRSARASSRTDYDDHYFMRPAAPKPMPIDLILPPEQPSRAEKT